MQDRMAMTHEFAFALDSELCRPSSQRVDAAHRPWLDSLNEATRRQHLHYKSLRGSWNLSEYAQRKLSWLRESCPVASLGPDGTIGFAELTGGDAEPYRECGSEVMAVRRELTATGGAMNSLHMDPGRFLYDDGHTTICPTGVRKTQGVRLVGGRAATSQDAGSHTRQ